MDETSLHYPIHLLSNFPFVFVILGPLGVQVNECRVQRHPEFNVRQAHHLPDESLPADQEQHAQTVIVDYGFFGQFGLWRNITTIVLFVCLVYASESSRRMHPLSYECDIIETCYMRVSLLQMTFGKHMDRKHICFFAGAVSFAHPAASI